MSDRLLDTFPAIVLDLDEIASSERRAVMEGYMRDQFEFLGVAAPDRRAASKSAIQLAKEASASELIEFAQTCWAQSERELQNIGADVLRAGARHLRPADLPAVRTLIETTSWWDTIDTLALWTVGIMVKTHPALVAEMESVLGFAPEIRFHGTVDAIKDESIVGHLLPVLREGLSNIARHAHATAATITLAVGAADVHHARSDLHVAACRPGGCATANAEPPGPALDRALYDLVDGLPPPGSVPLAVRGSAATTAWRGPDGQYYINTSEQLILPACLPGQPGSQARRSSDGTRACITSPVNSLLVSRNGQTATVWIE